MSELEIYIQEQCENDQHLKEIQNQRTKEENVFNGQKDSQKVISFLQKMNLRNFDSNQVLSSSNSLSNQNINQQNATIIKNAKSQNTSNFPSKKQSSIHIQQNQDIQASFQNAASLIKDQMEYELCKNVIKKPKHERNDKDLSILQITLGNNLELLQKYKTFLPMKNFKDVLLQFDYEECSPFQQIMNIESKSNRIYFLLKGEVAIFIPRLENSEEQQESDSPKRFKESKDSSPKKIQLRKSSTQQAPFQTQTIQIQETNNNEKEAYNNIAELQLQQEKETKKYIDKSENTANYVEDENIDISWIKQIKENFKKEMEEKFKNFKLLKFAQVGDMFGETSLEYRNQEIFSVVCVTNCEFAVLEQSAYYNYFSHKFFLTHLEIDKMFRKTQLFCEWPHYALYEFSKIAKRNVLRMHEVLFNIGDTIDRIYFMCSGLIHKVYSLQSAQESQSPITKFTGTTAFGEEGIIDANEEVEEKRRQYQIVSKREDTVVYSIEKSLFMDIYFYIVAKEGLDSYEEQQEKKKRLFLDSIYRSIRQMERIQILERTIEDIKKQRVKENKRKQLQKKQILNENQMLYAITNDELDHIQLNHYLKHELENKQGESIPKISLGNIKKRSLSQMNSRQQQGMYNVTNFHFAEKELTRFKQIQINKIDSTINQEYHSNSNSANQPNFNQNTDLMIQPAILTMHNKSNHNNNNYSNKNIMKNKNSNGENNYIESQQNQQSAGINLMAPSKKLEQLKYNVVIQHLNQQTKNQKNVSFPNHSSIFHNTKKQKFTNCDKFNIQKYPQISQSDSIEGFFEQENLIKQIDNLNKQEDTQNNKQGNNYKQLGDNLNKLIENENKQVSSVHKQVEFDVEENKNVLNELQKVDEIISNQSQQINRTYKINYNHYKNVIQNVNQISKSNNFYDNNHNNNLDLFKNSSFLFEKNTKNQANNDSNNKNNYNNNQGKYQLNGQSKNSLINSSSKNALINNTSKSRNQSADKHQQPSSSSSVPVTLLRKTPFQKYKESSEEVKKIIGFRRSQSEKKYDFSVKIKSVELQNQQQHVVNQSIVGSIDLQMSKNVSHSVSLANLQQQNTTYQQQQQLSDQQIIKSSPKASQSAFPNYIMQMISNQNISIKNHPQSIEDINSKRILNSPKLHQIDLTMNAQSVNKVFKNTIKQKSWQNPIQKILSKSSQHQMNQTELRYPSSSPPHNQGDRMRCLQNHVSNFDFYARCKQDTIQSPYDILDRDQNTFQDFISRPCTAAVVQNICSKKTLIKDLVKQTYLQGYMTITNQKNTQL